jgi:hypothetical protein
MDTLVAALREDPVNAYFCGTRGGAFARDEVKGYVKALPGAWCMQVGCARRAVPRWLRSSARRGCLGMPSFAPIARPPLTYHPCLPGGPCGMCAAAAHFIMTPDASAAALWQLLPSETPRNELWAGWTRVLKVRPPCRQQGPTF